MAIFPENIDDLWSPKERFDLFGEKNEVIRENRTRRHAQKWRLPGSIENQKHYGPQPKTRSKTPFGQSSGISDEHVLIF